MSNVSGTTSGGHQAVAVNFQSEFLPKLLQSLQIDEPIFVSSKDILPVVASLHDVVRVMGKCDPSLPWHPCLLRWNRKSRANLNVQTPENLCNLLINRSVPLGGSELAALP